jgi:GNAT superfamily N-acetyltransferase
MTNPAHALLDEIEFMSGHYSEVPAELAASFLAAGLYEDDPKRAFKRRWSDPASMTPDHLHYFAVAYHSDSPVAVAYGNMAKNYTMYERENGEVFALADSGLGVYVLPKYRGIGIAHGLVASVLNHMAEGRGEERPGTRMAIHARRFCAYMVNEIGEYHKRWITCDDLLEHTKED